MGLLTKVEINFYKMVVSLLGLLFVLYVLVEFRIWSMEWTEYFLKRAGWLEIIFISLVVAGISTVILKLFQWHIRMQAGGR